MVKKINPIARFLAFNRKRKQVIPGKRKYNRKKSKNNLIRYLLGNKNKEGD